MSNIENLQRWYKDQCNGDWEHSFGVKIDTLDNPGWSVTIDLIGTLLERTPFAEVSRGVGADCHPTSDDWYICKVEKGQFKAFGGPQHLKTVLSIFLKWATNE